MPTIALLSGALALLAGITKYVLDSSTARHSRTAVTVSVGNESIQLPANYTPDQVAAVLAILKDKAASEKPSE